jgi:hypothetical protein
MGIRTRLAQIAGALCLVAATTAAADPREVETAFQSVQQAVEARDVAALESLVHPEFEMLHALGQIEGRAGWLALVRSGRLPRQTAERHEYDVTVRLAGPIGLRGSIVRFRDTRLGRDMWMRGTATFVREDGRWRQIRQQSTLLSDAPMADLARADDYVGAYDIPGRDGFRVAFEDGLLHVQLASGAVLPLVPLGADRFGAGPTSHMTFIRDAAGQVVTVTRAGPEGPWWTAQRRPKSPSTGPSEG